MTLRDEEGEIEVGIGDQFELKTGPTLHQLAATFSIVCPDFTVSATKPPIWVRLIKGSVDIDGKHWEVRQGANEEFRCPVLLFTGELVARLVREHRLMTFDIPTVPQIPAQNLAKASRARTSKKDSGQQEPNSDSLFA